MRTTVSPRDLALRALGLNKAVVPLTAEIVHEAFRAAVKASHPDLEIRRADPEARKHIDLRDSPVVDMDALTKAKEFLLRNLGDEADSACKLCSGRGSLPSGMGWRQCVACKGAGVSR